MINTPRTQLINLINSYLSSKKIWMEPVMKNIRYRLINDQFITIKQFRSIIKWVERDLKMNRDDLILHFSSVILELQPKPESVSLEPFFEKEPINECSY